MPDDITNMELCTKDAGKPFLKEAAMAKLLQLPDPGRIATKTILRQDLSRRWEKGWEAEVVPTVAMLKQPQVANVLGAVMQRMSGKKKRKAQPSKL